LPTDERNQKNAAIKADAAETRFSTNDSFKLDLQVAKGTRKPA